MMLINKQLYQSIGFDWSENEFKVDWLTVGVDEGMNDMLVSVNGGEVKSCVTL